MLLFAKQHDHRHRLGERLFEIHPCVDLDKMATDHADCLVIGETLGLRNDDPVDHPLGKGQPQHPHRVVAGDAGRRP
jgi:hypothetical protein